MTKDDDGELVQGCDVPGHPNNYAHRHDAAQARTDAFAKALGADVVIPLETGEQPGSVGDLLAKRAWFDRRRRKL